MNYNLLILASFILVLQIDGFFAASFSKVSNQTTKTAAVEENCLDHDFQIQSILSSTKPPFDNYFNISRAIYPSEDISSTLVNIYVHFTNSSVDHTEFDVQEFIWSRSCLYVSDRFLSLQAMSWYSLGTVYPVRRQQDLHITLYRFCRPEDSDRKLLYFLSTLEDIARNPTVIDPSLNSAECVVKTDDKYKLKGWKKLFPYMCWPILLFSVLGSQLMSMIFVALCRDAYKNDPNSTVNLKDDDNSTGHHKDDRNLQIHGDPKGRVIKAMLFLLCVLFCLGFIPACFALSYSTNKYHIPIYPVIYIVSIFLVMLRRWIYCCFDREQIEELSCNDFFKGNWTWKLDNECDKNPPCFFLCTLYPGCFVAVHHILWIMIGIITEPFWAVSVFIAWMVVALAILFLAFHWHKIDNLLRFKWDKWDICHFVAVFLGVLSLAPMLFTLFLVGNPFFHESLIASIIPTVFFLIIGIWFKLIRNKGRSKRNNSPSSNGEETEMLDKPSCNP